VPEDTDRDRDEGDWLGNLSYRYFNLKQRTRFRLQSENYTFLHSSYPDPDTV
jgi:hypothetical protein